MLGRITENYHHHGLMRGAWFNRQELLENLQHSLRDEQTKLIIHENYRQELVVYASQRSLQRAINFIQSYERLTSVIQAGINTRQTILTIFNKTDHIILQAGIMLDRYMSTDSEKNKKWLPDFLDSISESLLECEEVIKTIETKIKEKTIEFNQDEYGILTSYIKNRYKSALAVFYRAKGYLSGLPDEPSFASKVVKSNIFFISDKAALLSPEYKFLEISQKDKNELKALSAQIVVDRAIADEKIEQGSKALKKANDDYHGYKPMIDDLNEKMAGVEKDIETSNAVIARLSAQIAALEQGTGRDAPRGTDTERGFERLSNSALQGHSLRL